MRKFPFIIFLLLALNPVLLSAGIKAPSIINLSGSWSYSLSPDALKPEFTNWQKTSKPYNPTNIKAVQTVWFSLQLPGTNTWNPEWKEPCIYIESALQEFSVYRDGAVIYQSRSSKDTSLSYFRWNIIPVLQTDAGKTLVFEVHSDVKGRIGFDKGIIMQEHSSLINSIFRHDLDYILLGSFFALIGILLLVISILTQPSQRLFLISLGFFALCGGLFIVTLANAKQLFFDAPVFWFYLQTFSLVLFPIGIAIFVGESFGGSYQFILKFLWILDLVYAGFVLDSVIKKPEYFSAGFLIPFYILVIFILSVCLIALITESMKGNPEAIIFNIGFGIFGLTLLFDIGRNFIAGFRGFEWIMDYGFHWTFHFGMLFFMLTMALIMTLRFVENHALLENYSRELEATVDARTKELQTMNTDLETEIEERVRAEDSLLKTNEKLRIRNDIMENELSMARDIQFQLIPSKSPSPNISFYYKPMDQVGGDFYDFIDFPDENKIGIFVSDVSGHGVPAAFITSMIKSFIQRSTEIRHNPAEFLAYMNGALIKQTGGNFITAFYGIYDRKTHEFLYSNAGHNVPYIIQGSELLFLDDLPKGFPLAVLNTDEMTVLKKGYINRSKILTPGSKLFLYTDGLVEAVNIQDKITDEQTPDFESTDFQAAVSDNRNFPAAEFTKKLVERLIAFRGTDSFDDDVCMICVDVLGT